MTAEDVPNEMIVAAARVLNERTAKACNVDAGDQWRWYSDGFKDDARAAIAAAINASGCVLVPMPEGLHPSTADLVRRFASALAEKLRAAEQKYDYRDGWTDPGWMDECRTYLLEHVRKGDPRDVAAYCAFLWHHGEPTMLAAADPREQALDRMAENAQEWGLYGKGKEKGDE